MANVSMAYSMENGECRSSLPAKQVRAPWRMKGNGTMKKKKLAIILVIFVFLVAGVALAIVLLNRTEKYYVPLELLLGENSSTVDENEIEEFEKYQLKPMVAKGVCESVYINSNDEIVFEYTKEQKEAEIDGLVEIMTDNMMMITFIGTSYYKYNDDYTKITVSIASEDNLDNLISFSISSMLLYQIYNDVPADEASVVAEITYLDSGKKETVTYNCYNLHE